MAGIEKKNVTKSKIVNYIINHKATSKVELSKDLNISMPTVLSNVKELLAGGIVIETGEYESTGGRKAKKISINPAYRYAVGIRITAKHIGFVLVNMKYEIEKYERIRLEFSTNTSYYSKIREELEAFLKDVENRERILGIGISIPGIVNLENRMLVKSHALQLENYSLNFLEQVFSLPVYFENDANAAMRAEDLNRYKNARVLLIDDLFKGNITPSDINIIFEIINYRYFNNKPIIVSTEKYKSDLLKIDEAIGSRILEMCDKFNIEVRGKGLNYRIYG